LAGAIKIAGDFKLKLGALQRALLREEAAMLVEPVVAFEIGSGPDHGGTPNRHLEMKWITTEHGLEASWVVLPERPAHFVLQHLRLVPASAY
jgi:hypothetical protein